MSPSPEHASPPRRAQLEARSSLDRAFFIASSKDDFSRLSKSRQQPAQIFVRECDAAFRRRKSRSRHMHENGAAATPHARTVVEAKDDDDVVEAVVTPQPFVARAVWQRHHAVVVSILGTVAPAVAHFDRRQRKNCFRSAAALGVEKNPAHRVSATRRGSVAFALESAYSGTADRARHIERPVLQASLFR